MAEVERWTNLSKGIVALPSWDSQGRMNTTLVQPGATVPVRTADREQAMGLRANNAFVNGILKREDASGGGREVDEVASVLKLRGARFNAAVKRLSQFDLHRLRDLADEDESVTAAQQKTIKEAVLALVPQGTMPSYEDLTKRSGE